MSLDDDVLAALKEEIGPSAARLLSRCAKKALNKSPSGLTRADLPALADACHAAVVPVLGTEAAGRIRGRVLKLSGIEEVF
ncbi:hypothetical protein RJ40_02950 [Methanofollis aquaemaris]|uniref:Uncharacterized protein n=1 Tax=Methanofollis aquaemaris TaxID=126734 RepID=A0A8A3S463_9EURY|nr:hypothetical protein [Methanofollis aquaemaris]QSZ66531.1 hypothetical protein RJ40_02950 [Methanofollis aquaemaris]